jgi:phosphoenolpyruvate phosphomutase
MSTTFRNVLAKNNGPIRICEVHDRASTELVRDSVADNGQAFDGVWISGLTQTTILGVPDTELISPLTRASLATPVYKPLQNNGRPLCAAFDADSGGDAKDIPALVSVLALKGVSMIIIEDKAVGKPGEKVNSLLATSDKQGQADPQEFANVIRTFKEASKDKDVMVTARIESFTTRVSSKEIEDEKRSVDAALSDALERAKIYCQAGADGIMIHSKSKDPNEILSFLHSFRHGDKATPLIVVPTSYSKTHRSVLADAGANIFIYANHLLRAKISAASATLEEEHGQKLNLFDDDQDLARSRKARNYACLLRQLAEKRYLGEHNSSSEVHQCGLEAEKRALENIRATIKDLAGGELSGCEADHRIIPVKELLHINAKQVSPL